MFRKNNILVVLLSALFLFISAPFSSADNISDYTAVAGGDGLTVLLGAESTIIINAGSVDVENNVYTFTAFDPAIANSVPDPENYVLSSGGVLLQARVIDDYYQSLGGGGMPSQSSSYEPALTTLIAENNVLSLLYGGNALTTVTDLSAVSFTFTTDVLHNVVSLDFILASKEYYTGDWDIAAIFIDGQNYAFLPNGNVLRVNESAQITNVCTTGVSGGCLVSQYSLNGILLGTISPKLTLYASIDSEAASHTLTAIVANTDDNAYPSSLLFGNFQSFQAQEVGISTFTLGDQTFDFGIQIDDVQVETVIVRPEVADPNQKSTITGSSVSSPDANKNVTVKVSGTFVEEILAIQINGARISSGTWVQDATSVTFTVPVAASGKYAIQLFNGSAPVLEPLTVVATS